MSRPRTAPRRDAWHFAIGPDDSRRELIISWHSQDGESSCRRRMLAEMGIGRNGKPISIASFYSGLNYWRAEKVNEMRYSRAKAQAAAEAKEKNLNPEQADELTLRNYIAEADASDDRPLYIELSKLRIADQVAKTKAETDRAKIRQKDEDLRQAQERLEILKSKEAKTKEALGDGTLSLEQRQARIKEIFGVQ